MRRMGQPDAQKLDQLEQHTIDTMTAKSRALANTARLWDDGMIDPRDTRRLLCEWVETAYRTLSSNVGPKARGLRP